jgi:GT2 family glycosyltransferase
VIWSAGSTISFAKSTLRGCNEEDRGQYDGRWRAPQVVGAAILARTDALSKAGMFDKDYFAYYEDTKLCTEMVKAGWEIWYEPSAKVWHKVAASTGGGSSPTSIYYLVRNRFHYVSDEFAGMERLIDYSGWLLEVAYRKAFFLSRLNLPCFKAVCWAFCDAMLGIRGKHRRRF